MTTRLIIAAIVGLSLGAAVEMIVIVGVTKGVFK
jgi:hypothetical protein